MKNDLKMSDVHISTNKSELDVIMIHNFLSQSYWAKDISIEKVRKSIENSLTFGVYHIQKQVGFARLITDRATFGYLADVFILPEYRGLGLSKMLMNYILGNKELQSLRSIMLATRDAHLLYAKFGFKNIDHPEKYMLLQHNGKQ